MIILLYTMIVIAAVLFGILLVSTLTVWFIFNMYNQLISLENRVSQSKKNIDVLLKQRRDELEKLIDAVNKSMNHEEELLNELTNTREKLDKASSPKEQANANEQVENVMSKFTARMEDYPELKSQENIRQFQDRIAEIEEDISNRRETYNESVTIFNTKINQFPYLIIANMMGYNEKQLFEATQSEKKDVNVSEQLN